MTHIHALEQLSDGDGTCELTICDVCGHSTLFNRSSCTRCGSTAVHLDTTPLEGSTEGVTVVTRSRALPWRDRVPYGVAYVRLKQGPTVVASFDAGEIDVAVGTYVTLSAVDDDAAGGLHLRVVSA